MNNRKIKHKFFIEKYENDIKDLRTKYYKNLVTSQKKDLISPSLSLLMIPFLIAIIIILKNYFSIKSYIIAIIAIIISNILISILSSLLKLEETKNYKSEIRKLGYFSIEDYEQKLKKYITGDNGYYSILLNDLIQEYNINETTKKIFSVDGEGYYIWTNQNQDTINLLNCQRKSKPEIKSIKISSIRYFRIDNMKNCIILKSDTDELYLKLDSLPILNEIIKEKRLENIKNFTPENYINDFEIYMHTVKHKLEKKNQRNSKFISQNINHLIICLLGLCTLIGFSTFLKDYIKIINVTNIIFIFFINKSIKNIFSLTANKNKKEKDDIKEINNNPECIEKFEELKYSLGISNSFDKVYTNEGACYLTWVANGYFHVFLNVIYFNVVYMAIKTSDVNYYKTTGKECLIKLKDKTLTFKKEANQVFAKILPNKDYDWLKAYQKQNNML